MDQMELEEDKSLSKSLSSGASDIGRSHDSSLTKKSCPATSNTSSSIHTSVASLLPTNASSTTSTSSSGLFGSKATVIRPSRFFNTSSTLNTSSNDDNVGNPLGFFSNSHKPAMNIFACTNVDNKNFANSSDTNLTAGCSGSSVNSGSIEVSNSEPGIFGSTLHNPQVSVSNNSFEQGLSSRNKFTDPITLDKDNLNFRTWRTCVSPTRRSRNSDMKRRMREKYLKQLHHHTHYLRTYLASGRASLGLDNQDCSVSNQVGESPMHREVTHNAESIHSRIQKMVRRRHRQHKQKWHRISPNNDSSNNVNPELLQRATNSNSPTVELSTTASAVVSSSNLDIADADACFLKSILPDLKTLSDTRKLTFKSCIMGTLSNLIAEQKQDLDQRVKQEKSTPQDVVLPDCNNLMVAEQKFVPQAPKLEPIFSSHRM